MPATKTRDQGKTSFVKELLIDNPKANTKAVNDAWSKAGMDGNDQRDSGQQDEVADGPDR